MLILVAVSVSVALNGGLFNKASDAKDQTKEAVIREQLQDIVLGNLDVNNSTIPEELGSITLDGVTYAISAAEGTPDAETGEKPITITLTASGKEPINYNLKDNLKIGGVAGIKNNKPSLNYVEENTIYIGECNYSNLTLEQINSIKAQVKDNLTHTSVKLVDGYSSSDVSEWLVFSDGIAYSFRWTDEQGVYRTEQFTYSEGLDDYKGGHLITGLPIPVIISSDGKTIICDVHDDKD